MRQETDTHLEAKEYVENYRKRIADRFQKQKKEKEIKGVLDMDPEEKQEIEQRMREDMRAFVQMLQSKMDYQYFTKIYHKSMENVKGFNHMMHDYSKPSEQKKMGKHHKSIKEKYFKLAPEKRNAFVESYEKQLQALTPDQKKKVLRELDRMASKRAYFDKQKASFMEVIKEMNPFEAIMGPDPEGRGFGFISIMVVISGIIALGAGAYYGKPGDILTGGIMIGAGLIYPSLAFGAEYETVKKRIKREKTSKGYNRWSW